MDKCTQCHRAGPELTGNNGRPTCGSPLACPKAAGFVPVDPAKDVVIHCDKCVKTRALPAWDILQGGNIRVDHTCPRSPEQCGARVVSQAVPHTPAPQHEPEVAQKAKPTPKKA